MWRWSTDDAGLKKKTLARLAALWHFKLFGFPKVASNICQHLQCVYACVRVWERVCICVTGIHSVSVKFCCVWVINFLFRSFVCVGVEVKPNGWVCGSVWYGNVQWLVSKTQKQYEHWGHTEFRICCSVLDILKPSNKQCDHWVKYCSTHAHPALERGESKKCYIKVSCV